MGLPRELVTAVRRLDESQLRRLLILGRGLLLDSEAPVVEIDDVAGMPTVRYTQKHVRCNKQTCSRCPHGPYWYASWHEDGRKRSQYIGSELPAEVRRRIEELDAARAREAAETAPSNARAAAAGATPGGRGDSAPPLRLISR